jgi:hypothetical protein
MTNQQTLDELSVAQREARAFAYGAMRGYVLHGADKQRALDAIAEADKARSAYNEAFEAWNERYKASK